MLYRHTQQFLLFEVARIYLIEQLWHSLKSCSISIVTLIQGTGNFLKALRFKNHFIEMLAARYSHFKLKNIVIEENKFFTLVYIVLILICFELVFNHSLKNSMSVMMHCCE